MVASEDAPQTSASAVQQIGGEPGWSPLAMTPELAARRQAIKDLIAFTEYTCDRYGTALHHRLMGEQLERVEWRD
jgi:hypothetical protein